MTFVDCSKKPAKRKCRTDKIYMPNNIDERYYCPKKNCGKSFANKGGINKHIEWHERQEKNAKRKAKKDINKMQESTTNMKSKNDIQFSSVGNTISQQCIYNKACMDNQNRKELKSLSNNKYIKKNNIKRGNE